LTEGKKVPVNGHLQSIILHLRCRINAITSHSESAVNEIYQALLEVLDASCDFATCVGAICMGAMFN
jgi:hypothetical protein